MSGIRAAKVPASAGFTHGGDDTCAAARPVDIEAAATGPQQLGHDTPSPCWVKVAPQKGIERGSIEVWFADETRVGQKDKTTRRKAGRGSRPAAPKDQRTESTYIFGAICSVEGKTAGLILASTRSIVPRRPSRFCPFGPGAMLGRVNICVMQQLPGLQDKAFVKRDSSPDAAFYLEPRFVEHIDAGAIAAVTKLYAEILPRGGAILDLMSSWVSHLPADAAFASVVGHGMNAKELAANPRLSSWFVQDLNEQPMVPLESDCFDAACLCVSVQYLQRPVDVFREVARVLRPGSPFVVSFSNRCFPTKAVAIWQALAGPDQQVLVGSYMKEAGFVELLAHSWTPRSGDPLWTVTGRAPG